LHNACHSKNQMAMTHQTTIYILSGLVLILIVYKTVLFFSSTSTRTFYNWVHFSDYTIYNSRNEKSKKSKQLQNKLTLTIAALILIEILVALLLRTL